MQNNSLYPAGRHTPGSPPPHGAIDNAHRERVRSAIRTRTGLFDRAQAGSDGFMMPGGKPNRGRPATDRLP